ncbi:MAG: hypothetical protein QM715_07155 [Nibricoccus sp.]
MTIRALHTLLPFVVVALSVAPCRAAEPAQPTPTSLEFAQLSATDLPTLKSALTRAGWPKSHVQALLNAEIQRRFKTDFTPTFEDMRTFEFWRTGPDALPLAHLDTPERRKEIAERENKAREAYESLFPVVEEESGPLTKWEDQRRWGSLSQEKRATVEKILKSAEQFRDKFLKERGRMLTREEWEMLWAANRESRNQLAKALTPDELLDYDLRNSNTAAQMRGELDSFEPTRDEFLAIFRLRHPLELNFEDKPKDLYPDVETQRAAAEKLSTQKIAELLGPERFDDYQLSLQSGCQVLRFDGRYARISAAEVRSLYRVFLATQAKLKEAETLPAAEKDRRTAELKASLFSRFRSSLDEEGTRRYLQEQGLWP